MFRIQVESSSSAAYFTTLERTADLAARDRGAYRIALGRERSRSARADEVVTLAGWACGIRLASDADLSSWSPTPPLPTGSGPAWPSA